jgi:GTPase SAR1 family protein
MASADHSRDSDGAGGRPRNGNNNSHPSTYTLTKPTTVLRPHNMPSRAYSTKVARSIVKNMDINVDTIHSSQSMLDLGGHGSRQAKEDELHPEAPFDLSYDIAVIGNKGVGKTSVLLNEIEKKMCHEQVVASDPAVDDHRIVFRKCMYRANMMLTNNPYDWQSKPYIIRVNYWDCSGDEKHMEEVCRLARHCAGVIYMFDITDRKSFDDMQEWIGLVEKQHMDLDLQEPRRRNSMVYDYRMQPNDAHRKTVNTKTARHNNHPPGHSEELGVLNRKVLLANKGDLRATDVIRVAEIRRLAKDYDLDYFVTSAETGES